MAKDFYYRFRKVGFIRNRMIFLYAGLKAPLYEKIFEKYGDNFFIFFVKKGV